MRVRFELAAAQLAHREALSQHRMSSVAKAAHRESSGRKGEEYAKKTKKRLLSSGKAEKNRHEEEMGRRWGRTNAKSEHQSAPTTGHFQLAHGRKGKKS